MSPAADETAEEDEAVEVVATVWPVRELLPVDGWFPIVLLCGFAVGLFVSLRTRKQNRVRTTSMIAACFVLCLAIWYLYPSMTYKGTYSATYGPDGMYFSVIQIQDDFTVDGRLFGPYQVSPFQRILWVSLPEAWWPEEVLPVKLGWGNISVPTPKVGWVKYKKQSK